MFDTIAKEAARTIANNLTCLPGVTKSPDLEGDIYHEIMHAYARLARVGWACATCGAPEVIWNDGEAGEELAAAIANEQTQSGGK